MTRQALNSIALYKGNDPAKIEALLAIQSSSVVAELKAHFHADTLSELAVKLSIGEV